jgi:small subunit ribosomal protein S6
MRKYEVMFIIRPDVPEEDVDKVITQMESAVTQTGGKIEKVDKMGRRRLAYRVARCREGLYVLFTLEGSGDTTKELERRLKVNDAVIKFLTVRIDEELERAEKWKALRAKQAGRKPKSPPPGPQGAEVQPILVKE